ncbi:UPF0149 family protein [Dyella sp.]|uniref:UPF0149 family protein n=1 Tax=Dyella sp. TaxID=1869338 RepID=UPI002ED2A71A
MSVNDWIGHDELNDSCVRMRLGADAAELHGSLCGFLAGGGKIGRQSLLAVLQLDGEGVQPGAQDQALLERLVKQCEAELDDPELGFEPLLPADDRPLPERAEALVDWCRGFLGGFGLAGTDAHASLSDEAKEILRDLGSIAGAELDFGEEGDDEDALIEVHEFVRVGAMLLFAECAGGRGKTGSDRIH